MVDWSQGLIVMSNNFLAHAIRDVFEETNFTVIYGLNFDLRNTLASPEHGIGAFILHTERNIEDTVDYSHFWEAGINHPFFSADSVDLLISVNYSPKVSYEHYDFMALQLCSVLKSGGLMLLINPGDWASYLEDFFILREDLIKELCRFQFLFDQKVFVYENI